MDRRKLLLLSGAALSGLAGCAIPTSGSTNVTLSGISLVNTTSTAVEFDVIVESDDRIVYWESHEIDSAPDDSQTNIETIVPDLPDEYDNVAVHGRVNGQRRTINLGRENFDNECVLPSFIYQISNNIFGTTVDLVDNLSDPPEEVNCQN